MAARRCRFPHIWAVHENLSGKNAFLRVFFGYRALIHFMLRNSCAVAAGSRPAQKSLGHHPKIRLVLNGWHIAEPGQSAVEIRRLNLTGHVRFTGYRTDPASLLEVMDLLISSSPFESFGLTILEAILLKTPVLALNCGGPGEIISDRKTGFLYDKMNPEILAEAAKRISDNPVLRKGVIRKAARTAAEDYSPDRWIANFEKLIEECLKKDLSSKTIFLLLSLTIMTGIA